MGSVIFKMSKDMIKVVNVKFSKKWDLKCCEYHNKGMSTRSLNRVGAVTCEGKCLELNYLIVTLHFSSNMFSFEYIKRKR